MLQFDCATLLPAQRCASHRASTGPRFSARCDAQRVKVSRLPCKWPLCAGAYTERRRVAGLTTGRRLAAQAGFNFYKAGRWLEAKGVLEQTYTMRRGPGGEARRDAPSKVLLDFMASYQYLAPGDWAGFRELTEK